ncbi:unnamed protein product [Onchocerca flexuosa]|uniref:Ovule protein n=1 Tax=Onchocerca flexuosa TaxID=387005 RepID=A0A183HF26_9BILA|nr:unnamed protein product [Onchocerca flexuosa]
MKLITELCRYPLYLSFLLNSTGSKALSNRLFRLDSIRFDMTRLDSIQFNSIQNAFHSTPPFPPHTFQSFRLPVE